VIPKSPDEFPIFDARLGMGAEISSQKLFVADMPLSSMSLVFLHRARRVYPSATLSHSAQVLHII
jgi:hypothetical protein